MEPVELILGTLFGVGTPLAWSIATIHSYRSWRKHHDARAGRELLAVMALLLAAMASGFVIFLAVTQPDTGTALRRVFSAFAGGMFFAAGIVFAVEQSKDDA